MTKQEKADLVAEFRRVDMNLAKFCAMRGINPSTFRGWLKRDKTPAKTEATTCGPIEEKKVVGDFDPDAIPMGTIVHFGRNKEYAFPMGNRTRLVCSNPTVGRCDIILLRKGVMFQKPYTPELKKAYEAGMIVITDYEVEQ